MNYRRFLIPAGLLGAIVAQSHAAGVDCRDEEAALAYWRPIKAQAADESMPADSLAIELVSCLGSPNPELRDGTGYELFTYWLREQKISDETRHVLLEKLSAELAEATSDASLSRSFSALILAEIMRSDSLDPFMSEADRQSLLGSAIAALGNESDFRGLDADLGWVHPVAHMADLLWRFTLHPETSAEQATAILEVVRSKIAPTGVAYAFNEGDRLARAVSTMIRRKLIDAEIIAAWIRSFESPQSMEKWSDAFRTPQGMNELHNTKQFLRALSDQLNGVDVDRQISEPLDELIAGFTQLI